VATAQMDTVIRHLRRVVLLQDGADRTDGELLASFIDQKDEVAFEALMRRHGPMVLAVCRRIVRNHHDAEDAFQATFLVLARKASSIKPRGMVANWLHGVAFRTAMKAKTMTAKRHAREKQTDGTPEPAATEQNPWHDVQDLLDQELNGLPENYRLPILLCDLEGKTIKDAAQQLGWPQGTLAGRLARGRKLLAKRLANRGVVLSAGSLAAIVSQSVASAGVPTLLMVSTVKAATLIAAGQSTVAGVVPAKVAALMEGVLKAMLLSKLKTAGAVLFIVLGLIALGGRPLENPGVAGQTAPPQAKAKPDERPGDRELVTPEDRKEDVDALQGSWAFQSLILDGNEAPAEIVRSMSLIFKGDRMTLSSGITIAELENGKIRFGLGDNTIEMKFRLRGSNPKQIQTDADKPGISITYLYKLNGNQLTICAGTDGKTPVEFTAKKGTKQEVWVLKRLPHAPAPPLEIDVEKLSKDKVNLPRGAAPVQALVRLSDDK